MSGAFRTNLCDADSTNWRLVRLVVFFHLVETVLKLVNILDWLHLIVMHRL